jgi:hypothetical protein
VAGACTLELVGECGQLTFTPPQRDRYNESHASAAEFTETFRRANDSRYAATALPVRQGAFTAELRVPHSAHGACYVRAFIGGAGAHAVGATKILVKAPAAP